jgi:hypothetical protein
LADPGAFSFGGNDLSGFRSPHDDWQIAGNVALATGDTKLFALGAGHGIMVINGLVKSGNLLSVLEHGDVEAHVEFAIPRASNSGLYFQGRYEIQILDSWGVDKAGYGDCGAIYQRWADGKGFEGHAPRVNASRPPGEWQSFDVVFRAPRFDAAGNKLANARFVKVVLNGQVLHENVEVTGPTRASPFQDEKPTGPFMLQGDHGPVAYRAIVLRSTRLD